ncbi:Signal recognition particle receptor FtsY [Hyella patelloides LEGE 07179]|uniref:Signal recognition particle receptor FtsY n=1 Tax=Hyella patelloides LEGE 07179 TaxID=945734 RepID=A0A563W0V3_9CYAN|nr:signal recognition particle-docking protein FtsY [Hyella patelloides]VEP17329.1 Signal recognition particle receptor FtsY [Hyella patelloides LEGE 07179]
MFNWFRRNDKAKQEEPKTTPQIQEVSNTESTETTTETATKTQEDYLAWAKVAYQNIQEKKEEVQTSATELETSPIEETTETEPVSDIKETAVQEAVAEDIAEETTKTERISETEETQIPEKSREIITEIESKNATEETVVESVTEEETIEAPTNVPAWMQKSQGLEKLKETAIAEIEPEPELDEDFVWSAKVLAQQGRSPEDISVEEINWLTKLRQGLGKTRRGLIVQLKAVVGQGPLNKDAVEEIEALLLQADIGIEATDYIVETLQEKLKEEALPPEQAIAYLKTILQEILDKPLQGQDNNDFVPEQDILNIWLLTGVNGAGKTTTIGKLTNLAKTSGYNCLIAAADTFRAAAVQQVQVWGERTDTEVIANPGKNTDPAAVVYDAISAAKSRDTDLLLVDTAGRLQNKKNLMDELAKIRRVVDKNAPNSKIESLLVIDATLGQNSLYQAQVFSEVAQLSGVVLTKLDGSAKGGVALAIAQQLNLPIRFVGVGEGIEDLRPFSSYEFVEALLNG